MLLSNKFSWGVKSSGFTEKEAHLFTMPASVTIISSQSCTRDSKHRVLMLVLERIPSMTPRPFF